MGGGGRGRTDKLVLSDLRPWSLVTVILQSSFGQIKQQYWYIQGGHDIRNRKIGK